MASEFTARNSFYQGILRETNANMPKFLQENSTLSILGQHAVDLHSTDLLLSSGTTEDQRNSSTCGNACPLNNRGTFRQDYGRWTCGCHKLDGSLEQCTQASVGSCNWILLAYYSHEQFGEEIYWIPKLHHIHWNGQVVFQSDIHVCKS